MTHAFVNVQFQFLLRDALLDPLAEGGIASRADAAVAVVNEAAALSVERGGGRPIPTVFLGAETIHRSLPPAPGDSRRRAEQPLARPGQLRREPPRLPLGGAPGGRSGPGLAPALRGPSPAACPPAHSGAGHPPDSRRPSSSPGGGGAPAAPRHSPAGQLPLAASAASPHRCLRAPRRPSTRRGHRERRPQDPPPPPRLPCRGWRELGGRDPPAALPPRPSATAGRQGRASLPRAALRGASGAGSPVLAAVPGCRPLRPTPPGRPCLPHPHRGRGPHRARAREPGRPEPPARPTPRPACPPASLPRSQNLPAPPPPLAAEVPSPSTYWSTPRGRRGPRHRSYNLLGRAAACPQLQDTSCKGGVSCSVFEVLTGARGGGRGR